MKPMLASATGGRNLCYPLLASPKLDGVRALVVNGSLRSRSLKLIPNLHTRELFSRDEFTGFDGELIVGKSTEANVFQNTTSAVMTMGGRPDVVFCVFDLYTEQAGFAARLSKVELLIKKFSKRLPLQLVGHSLIESEQELLNFESQCLSLGYEGVMIRSLDGPYKHGRSTLKEGWLLKLKRFDDSEAEVIGVNQLMHNANEATVNELGQRERSSHKSGKVPLLELGALVVRDLKTGIEFELGTGFTHQQRVTYWQQRKRLIGLKAKYKYQAVGIKNKPRFPVFLGWRDAKDL